MRLKKFAIALLASVISTVGITATEYVDSSVVYAAESDFVIQNGVLTKYYGKGGDVVIPDGVTSIGSRVFGGCRELTSVSIPQSVTSIDSDAFEYCSGLTSITIPENVTRIGAGAFSGCGLKKIKVDSNNEVYDSRNNCSAIIETSSNTLVVGCSKTIIPESVTSIGDYAFKDCSGLTSITIPENVTSIGVYAFSGCGLKKIKVDSNNKVYDSRNNCSAIIETSSNTLVVGCSKTVIPESVTSIGNHAFYNCSELTSITIPDSITNIGYYAFSWCGHLTSITIPKSVTSICDMAFYECRGLTSITIPESVTSIGEAIFMFCSGLKAVCVSDNILDAKCPFEGCTNIKDICYIGKNKKFYMYISAYGEEVKNTVHYGHTEVKTGKDVAATYAKTGLTAATKCKYCGTEIKTQTVIPKKTLSVPKMTSVKNSANGKVTVKWNSVKDATGYQIYYTVGKTTKKITVKASSKASLSQVISKLTKGKSYSVKIRAYKTVGSKTYYSAWSSAKNVKINK